jgi:polysaccharide export outer membrane protein
MTTRFIFLAILIVFMGPALPAHAQTQAPAIAPWSENPQSMSDASRTARRYNALRQSEERETDASVTEDDIVALNDQDALEEALKPPAKTTRLQATPPRQDKRSALEIMYAQRLKTELPQFGYDLFGVPTDATQATMDRVAGETQSPMGEVQDNFILSSGDEIEVVFTGQRTGRDLYKIDSRGLLLIPDFPPIPSAGRTIGQVRISVDAAAANLLNTQAYVSLSSVRQIGVLVIGHVKKPGRQNLTVFHSVLDALMATGGAQKTGSLRQIKLVRDGRTTHIDLYELLLQGTNTIDLRLRDGDRVIVPAIGPTVVVAGEVKRPGIYEIVPLARNRSERLTLDDMLDLAGGVMAPGQNRFLKLAVTADGQEKTEDVTNNYDAVFGDGAVLWVARGQEKRTGSIELQGETRRPGLYALADHASLAKLLKSDDVLGDDVYPLIGVIERRDPDQLSSQLFDFPLRLVLKGEYDRKLAEGDVIHLFSKSTITSLEDETSPKTKNENEPLDPAMIDFLRERSAFVRGSVRKPGAYPVAEGTTLDMVLATAGGLALEANTANIEVTSSAPVSGPKTGGRSGTRRSRIDLMNMQDNATPIRAGDAVRVNPKFQRIEDKSVLLLGEVNSPGRYDLAPGDKLSDLLARAGGLTPQGYPEGAIFSRQSERRAEEARFRAQARQMRAAIAGAMEKEDSKIDSGKIQEARALAAELEAAQGVGRITVEAKPEALAAQPELDMLLEEGDRLYIPKRSLTVRVSGEVLSPASLQFRDGKKPRDYIHEAGGMTHDADDDRAFVIYPNGSAQPLEVSDWNHNPVFIPPGSTIVVPRDPKPFDFIESAKDISQILSNLAVTAIFVDDVKSD